MQINYWSFKLRSKTRLTILFSLCCIGLVSCLPSYVKNKEIEVALPHLLHTKYEKIILSSKKEVRIIYTQLDSTPKPLLVFIHGAPGNLLNFKNYHQDSLLQTKYDIISYDRPGYGTRKGGKAITELETQSKIISEIISYHPHDSIVLFAHSFGGPIALDYASRYSNIKSLVLCAVAVDPQIEKYFWFSKLGKWWLTRPFIGRYLRTTGSEKYSHEEELVKLEPRLETVTCPTKAYHGTKDAVVPYENMNYLKEKLIYSEIKIITFNGADHFFPSGYFNIMTKELADL